MNNGWSQKLQDLTRKRIHLGAILKDGKWNFAVVSKIGPDSIKIVEASTGTIIPKATDKEIATFKNVEELLEAGWVMD